MMNVVIVAIHRNDAIRICEAARWNMMSTNAPKIIFCNDPYAEDKLRGLSGGLMFITEGAQRMGVLPDIIRRALMQRIIIMELNEVVEI